MRPARLSPLFLSGLLALGTAGTLADPVSSPPAPWDQRLAPVPESDVSGAEPLMRDAIIEAREEVARLLGSPDTDPAGLAEAYGRLGALLVLREVETPADAAFRNAQTLQPGELRWPYYGGYLAMMTGNSERALEYLNAARALDPDYPPLYLRLGKVHLDRNELAEARADLEHITEVPGLEAAAHFYLGQIANLERRYQDAVTHLTATLRADPQATEAHWPLAQAYRALGQNDLAREHMTRVEPRTPPAKDPLLEQLQGAARQSVPAFERAVYAVTQHDYKAAVGEFEKGLAVVPDNQAARVSYARALYLSGNRHAAETELDRVLATEPDRPLALFLMALLKQQNGDIERAAELFRRTLELEPGHPGALYFLASLDLQAGRYGEAAAGYRGALAAEDAPPPARLLAIVAERRAGASDAESEAKITALLAESPDDPVLQYARVCLLAATKDSGLKDPKQALALASTLAFQQPGPPQMRALALSQAANGDFDGAVQTLGQAIAMSGGWLPPAILEGMEQELSAYREQRLDADPWPTGDPLLSPPPLDPTGPFRDYPDATPY